MKCFLFALSVVAAVIVQTKVSLFGVRPDLTVAIAYYIGLTRGSAKGAAAGSLIGLFEDSVEGIILGPNMLGKGMAGYFSSLLSGSPFRWTPLLGMLGIF